MSTQTSFQSVHLYLPSDILQEYERAVIFRLGRLIKGGARGPGVFLIIPCLDVYQKIDMRTATYDVPPQEVNFDILKRQLPSKWI